MNDEPKNLSRNIKGKEEINNQDLISKEIDNREKSSDKNRMDDSTSKTHNLSHQDEYEIKPQFNDGKSVFIGNLNFKVTEKDLKDFFSKIGVVEYVKIPMKCGRPMGVAFVNFETSQSALEAIKIYNEKDLLGRKAYMRLASEPHPESSSTSKKSQSQYSKTRNDKKQYSDYKKFEKSKRDYKDDKPLRTPDFRQRSFPQYDYDYDYYNYYDDYSEYDYDQRYRSPNYDQRISRERYIEQYQRREVRYYPPPQLERSVVYGDPYYIRPRIRRIGPNWY